MRIFDPARSPVAVAFRSLGQIAFSGSAAMGALVLAAIALISVWSAVGALFGAALGSCLYRWTRGADAEFGRVGLGGVNSAILGIMWGSALETGGPAAWLFPGAVAACVAVEAPIRRAFVKRGLPPLALAAVLTAWASAAVFDAFGQPFWTPAPSPPFEEARAALAVCLILAVLASVRARALPLMMALVALVAALGPLPLWAFNAAPAVFGVYGVFLAGSGLGARAGLAAGFGAAAIWLAWTAVLPLPPLLAPGYIAAWLALAVVAKLYGKAVLDFRVHRAVEAMRENRPAVALTGAGLGTASGIPDFTGSDWLDPDAPAEEFSHPHFVESAEARTLYWRSCARFRDVAETSAPNPGHDALAKLEKSGWLAGVVTQNVDGLQQDAGSGRVVPLHGDIRRVRCLVCDWRGGWPEKDAWAEGGVPCPRCGGQTKPAVIAIGENLDPGAWDEAMALAGRAGVLLIVGSRMGISSAAALAAEARRSGAKVVCVNQGWTALPLLDGDAFVDLPAEEALPAIETLLS